VAIDTDAAGYTLSTAENGSAAIPRQDGTPDDGALEKALQTVEETLGNTSVRLVVSVTADLPWEHFLPTLRACFAHPRAVTLASKPYVPQAAPPTAASPQPTGLLKMLTTMDGSGAAAGRGGSRGLKGEGTFRVEAPAGIGKAAIKEVIARNRGQLRYCYERELATKPNLEGKLVLELVIDASGKVSDVSTRPESTVQSDPLIDCVLTRAKGWVFPASGNVTTVVYPFIFKSGG